MANITVTTNQQVIDVTTSGGVNVTNTTDTITVLPSGTLNITTTNTDRLVAGSNQVILNTNATMTFPNNAIDFGSQIADLKSSAYSELWWHNANPTPTAGQGTNTYIWSWENQAGIAVESVGNSGKEWYFNSDGTTQFPGYKFPYADGSANQILKTNGSGVLSWYSPSDINTTYTIASAATTGGANLNLVGSDATTDTVKFASGTNVTVSRTDADTITIAATDTNTTYTQNASSVAGGANLNLVGSDSTTDSVKFASGTNVTVTRTDADTITIASTDTNTTYDFAASSTTGGANFNLTGSDATTDTVKLTNGGYITATYASGTEVTLGSNATDSNTPSTIVARDGSGNFSAAGATLGNIAVGVATDQTISTTSGDLILDSASGTVRVVDSQINSRNSSFTPASLAFTTAPWIGTTGLAVGSTTGYSPEISMTYGTADGNTANNTPSALVFRTSAGTSASPTATINNQVLGTQQFDGYATGGWASNIMSSNWGGNASTAWPMSIQTYARGTFASGTYTQSVTTATWAAGVATFNMALSNLPPFGQFQTVTISGVTPSGYNGTYVIQSYTNNASTNRFTVNLASDPGAYVSGGTITGTTVTNAPAGFRIRAFPASTQANSASRVSLMDINTSTATFKSNAFTFANEVIAGSTLTATNYLTLGSGGTVVIGDLNVKGNTASTSILNTFGGEVFMTSEYSTNPYAFPLHMIGKRTNATTPADGDILGLTYQAVGTNGVYKNIGTQSAVYRTSGDNSISFILDNNAGASTTPLSISAPATTIRAGTNVSVSDVATFTTANTTLKADALTLQTNAGVALVGNKISYNRVYGAFQYNTTVTPAAANTAYVFPIGTTDFANIVSVGSTSRIILGAPGIYNLQFSVQVENTANAEHVAYIWLRKNGTDVTASMGRITLLKSASTIAGWNYYIDSANTTDYYEIAYAVNDTAVIFPTYAATSFGPSTASLITTISPVGA